MSSLTSLADVNFDHDGKSIWPNILSAEEAALKVAPTKPGAKYNDRLIGIRVLGFFLLDLWQHSQHSFGLIPYKQVIKQIASCLSIPGCTVGSKEEAEAQHEKLQTLGLYYRNHLIRVCSSYPHSLLGCHLTFFQFGRTEARSPSNPNILLAHPWMLFETELSPRTRPQQQRAALARM
jgi:hypothetical protein